MIQETRQIKFKAWSKIGNAWLSDSEYSVLMIDLEGCLYKVQSDSCETPYRDIDNFILCQFTGIQDIHKKDVYEGDKTHDGVIEFNTETCCYIIRRANGTFIRLEVRKKDLEIIGNIHENPELLNQ